MNFREWDLVTWVSGLMAAIITAIANAIVVMVVDPAHFHLFAGGAKNLAQAAVCFGIVGAAAYLKQSPIPKRTIPIVLLAAVVGLSTVSAGCSLLPAPPGSSAAAAMAVPPVNGVRVMGTGN